MTQAGSVKTTKAARGTAAVRAMMPADAGPARRAGAHRCIETTRSRDGRAMMKRYGGSLDDEAIEGADLTDEEWAELIRWLGVRGLVLHIPIKGKPYLTDRANRYVGPF